LAASAAPSGRGVFKRRFTQRLATLSDAQRENLARWIQGIAAGALVAALLPRLAGYVTMVTGAVKALTLGFFGLNVASGGILTLLGGITTAFVGIAAGTTVGRGAFRDFVTVLEPIFEKLRNAFDALAPKLAPLFDGIANTVKAATPLVGVVIDLAAAMGESLVSSLTTVIQLLKPMVELLSELTKNLSAGISPVDRSPSTAAAGAG
jgi:phage-related protein